MSLGNDEHDKGRVDDAMEIWRKIIQLDPDNVEAHKRLGLDYLLKRDNGNAIPELEYVISKNPSDELVYKKLGMAYFEKGNFDGAVKAFQELVRLKPTDALAYNNLGSIYLKVNRSDDAINILEQAVKLDATKSPIYNNLGNAYYQKKDYRKARAQWAKSLQLSPDDETARTNLKTLDSMGE
jgi:Flp pilus assembly protein TadD